MRFLALLAAFGLVFGVANAEDKWPADYVPGTPVYSGERVGGEDVANAVVIMELPYADGGDTCGFLDDYDEVCPYSGSTSPDVVYQYTPTGDGLVDITLCQGATAYDTKLYVYEDEVTPGAPFACNDDECPGYVSELMGLQLNLGHTYFIVVDGYYGDCGYYDLDMTGDQGGSPAESPTWGTIKGMFK